jgi:hypothetical protein
MTTKKEETRVFNQKERVELISMVEHVLNDEAVSYSKPMKGYRVTCKAIPNSQRCVLSFVDTNKSKFKN